MTINFAHLHDQGIDFAVFDADSRCRTDAGRSNLLADLIFEARKSGLKVDKAALAYAEFGRLTFYGTPDLVRYLSSGWSPHWTHTLNV